MKSTSPAPILFSLIIPTFNESENIVKIIQRIEEAMNAVTMRWEIIFVDDNSPDGTSDVIREQIQNNPRLRLIQRIGRRGLSTAILEGMLSSSAPYVGVMDADLQHDERILPQMLTSLDMGADVVIGTRYGKGGSVGKWSQSRLKLSRLFTRLSRLILKADLSDPMSGFFLIRSQVMRQRVQQGVSGVGFKVLLDLFTASDEPLRFEEIPYTFRNRQSGESKLDRTIIWAYLLQILDRLTGRFIPLRFFNTLFISGVALLSHLSIMGLIYPLLGGSFLLGQSVAALMMIAVTLKLHQILSYQTTAKINWDFLKKHFSPIFFYTLSALINLFIANQLFLKSIPWLEASLIGALIGALWNDIIIHNGRSGLD
ncbi:polyprenol monophosphomannose synthase [Magnetococcales bacterium HHB-1]